MRCLYTFATACLIALPIASAFGYDVGDFSYSYNLSTKEATLTAYNGTSEHVTIPESFTVAETYKDDDGETQTRHHTITVTAIGDRAFANNMSITNVTFHDKLKSIGNHAFYCCGNLSCDIVLSRVTSIGNGAFCGSGIRSVKTSESLTYVGMFVFQGCGELVEVEINGTNLDLWESSDLFLGCQKLERVTFGDGVTRLSDGNNNYYSSRVFGGTTNLQYVAVGRGVTVVPSFLFSKLGDAAAKISVSFASPLTSIGYYAFHNSNITNLDIRLSQCSVEGYAFYGCPAVNERDIDFSEIVRIENYSAFEDCGNICGEIDLSNATSIGQSAFQDCTGITSLKFGESLASIGICSFSNCSSASNFVFQGAPPSVGHSAFSNVKCGAIGTYTAAHAAEWEAVIDANGYWKGLKMKPSYYTVIYDANNGTGQTVEKTIEIGTDASVDEASFAWEEHYFMGWAFEDVGEGVSHLTPGDALPWTPSGGETYTVHARWATIAPESANWAEGSITLAVRGVSASDFDGGPTVKYCDANGSLGEGSDWLSPEEGEITTAWSDDGATLLVTDAKFSSRLDGIKPIAYRIESKTGRCAYSPTTRNRFLLSVGYDAYLRANPIEQFYADASSFKYACVREGGFPESRTDTRLLRNATTKDIVDSLSYFVGETKPGDIFILYIATHGEDHNWYIDSAGLNREMASLSTYNGSYSVLELQLAVRRFDVGVAVVNIVMACNASAMSGETSGRMWVDNWLSKSGFDQCLGNVAWIVSCNAGQYSYIANTATYTLFGQSFVHDGFMEWYADAELYGVEFDGVEYKGGNSDGVITFGELGRYAGAFAKGISDDCPSDVKLENIGLLDRIVIAKGIVPNHLNRPEPPVGVVATQGTFDFRTKVSWSASETATGYRVYRCPQGLPLAGKWVATTFGATSTDDFSTSFADKLGVAMNKSIIGVKYQYYVKAINPVGVSEPSSLAEGWRGTARYLSYLAGIIGAEPSSIAVEEYDTMENTNAANGCRTVGECYALGIDPEDPDDDLKIVDFKMNGDKPEITINHTKDGSGNSFEEKVKILGKAELDKGEWQEVPPEGNPDYKFFEVKVELP